MIDGGNFPPFFNAITNQSPFCAILFFRPFAEKNRPFADSSCNGSLARLFSSTEKQDIIE